MLTIVIPCFNEFENLKKILKRIEYFSKDNNNVFFIIVDNGSTDQTKDFLHKYKKNNQISFCYVKKNIGYGHGILSGLKIASTEFLGWTHSDNAKNIDDIFSKVEFYPDYIHVDFVDKTMNQKVGEPNFDKFNPSVYGFLPTETKTFSQFIFSSFPVLLFTKLI